MCRCQTIPSHSLARPDDFHSHGYIFLDYQINFQGTLKQLLPIYKSWPSGNLFNVSHQLMELSGLDVCSQAKAKSHPIGTRAIPCLVRQCVIYCNIKLINPFASPYFPQPHQLTSWGHRQLYREGPHSDGTDGMAFVLALVMQSNPHHPQGTRGEDAVPPVIRQWPTWTNKQCDLLIACEISLPITGGICVTVKNFISFPT